MKPRFERISLLHGQSYACLEFREPTFDCPYHFHPEFELTYIVNSHGTAMVGHGLCRFGRGDVFLIGQSVPHAFHNSVDWLADERKAVSRVVQFRRDCLGSDFFTLPEMRGLAVLLEQARNGIRFLGEARVELVETLNALFHQKDADRVVGLLQLLNRAASAARKEREFLCSGEPVNAETAADEQRMKRVLDFIHANTTRSIAVEEVAAVAHLSPPSFSRFFRRATKQTFVRFVNVLRVNFACERLANTNDTVTEIAFAVGFGNLSNFNRRFLELTGRTPSEFRRDCRQIIREGS